MGDIAPPGVVSTQPSRQLIFSGPFNPSRPGQSQLTITNYSDYAVGFAIKTRCPQNTTNGLVVRPGSGVLEPGQATSVAVTRNFTGVADAQSPGDQDRVTVEWTNRPESSGPNTAFSFDWFTGDGMVRRKNLPVEYNI